MTKKMTLGEFNAPMIELAHRFEATGLEPHEMRAWLIAQQNRMYELPVNDMPTLRDLGEHYTKRMRGFLSTLKKEMDEGQEIQALMGLLQAIETGTPHDAIHPEDLDDDEDNSDEGLALHSLSVVDLRIDRGDACVPINKATISEFIEKEFNIVLKKNVLDEVMDALVRDGVKGLEEYILVSLADWFADMNVYNDSEAMKYGIPSDAVFKLVMISNFTKLGEDGLPIKNAEGKFEKGPNYKKPEPFIQALLFNSSELVQEWNELQQKVRSIETLAIPMLYTEVAPEGEDDDEVMDHPFAEEEDGEDEEE